MAGPLEVNLSNIATRMATEDKALRTLINGNAVDLSALDTTATNNLVAAINELFAAIGAANGATNLDETLSATQVVITSDTGTDATIPAADATNAGVMTAAMQTKLAGIETAADVTDAGNVGSAINGASAKTTPVGGDLLGLVDTEAANVLKKMTVANLANFVTSLIVDGSPGTLDTLNELAAALGDDPNFAATLTTALSNKQPLDATLTALANIATGADKLAYSTGTDAFAQTDLTAHGRALIGGANAAASRTTIDVWSKAEIGDVDVDLVATYEAGLV